MRTTTSLILLLAAALACGPSSDAFAQAKLGNEMQDIGKKANAESILAEKFPKGSRHEFAMVPMRDGVKLATDIFLPPGNGPWPVLLGRGYYGRLGSALATKDAQAGVIVYICQDDRGCYDSEGKGTVKVTAPDLEISDCAETLKWIAAQEWCNGKIGMQGASGNGVGPLVGFLAKDQHLVVSNASISCPYPYNYWGFHNGVRRALYGWLSHAGLTVSDWPKPTIPTYDLTHWKEVLAADAKNNPTILVLGGGWYDISPEAVLEVFSAGAATSKIFATITPNGHGGNCPFTFPQKTPPTPIPSIPSVADILVGKGKIPEQSRLSYFVMGNFRDKSAPGGFYKVTNTWPVPNTPTPYYFHADGSLSAAKPTEPSASQAYAYDPKDPAPSVGIKAMLNAGPHDQRPLKDRKDILHFTSAPLDAPFEITGKVIADLYVSTDVPDTEFVVKFIDVHPDGYEMMIRESAIFGRSAEEFQGKPAPLEKGKVYHLKMDLRSTAIILDKGHRLGVLVTSSSKPEYEVHPNSFVPVTSFDASPVAHQTIHLSSKYPSSIILPVVPVDKQ